MKLNSFANTLVTSLDRGKLIRALHASLKDCCARGMKSKNSLQKLNHIYVS